MYKSWQITHKTEIEQRVLCKLCKILTSVYTSTKNHFLYTLYNTVRYNTVLDTTRFKDGFQKCIDYIEK